MRIGYEFETHPGAILAERELPFLFRIDSTQILQVCTNKLMKHYQQEMSLPLSPGTARADEELFQLTPFLTDDQRMTALMAQQGIVPYVFLRLLTSKGIQDLHLDRIENVRKWSERKFRFLEFV